MDREKFIQEIDILLGKIVFNHKTESIISILQCIMLAISMKYEEEFIVYIDTLHQGVEDLPIVALGDRYFNYRKGDEIKFLFNHFSLILLKLEDSYEGDNFIYYSIRAFQFLLATIITKKEKEIASLLGPFVTALMAVNNFIK